MVQWTKEQLEAIEERENNILVSAAAGSGKTAVLVERIIQRLLDQTNPINIDEMLVATFTNAAAEEMRSRIRIALEQALQNNPHNNHIKKQLSLIQRASISTIHSFCLDIVRQYSYIIDLDPAFRIADEMEIDLLKHEVIDELFEEYYALEGEAGELFFTLVDMFSSDRSDAEMEKLVLHLHTFSKQHPQPERWLNHLIETYNVTTDEKEENIAWLRILKEEINELLHSFTEDITYLMKIANESDGPDHYIEALEADLQLIEGAKKTIDHWDDLQKYFKESKFKNLSSRQTDCDREKREHVRLARTEFRKQWNKLKEDMFSRSLESHLQDMETLYPIVKQLVQFVLHFEKRFSEEKRKRAIVDFNDLEHFALQILVEDISENNELLRTNIASYYERQFAEVLVDEYQDINLVQETILQAISHQEGKGNRFMVGDVKQSIYRFRHAEPTLFIQKYTEYAQNSKEGKRIDLARNFRSREEVLTGANFIFRQIFDKRLGDIVYDDQAELIYGNKGYDDLPLSDDAIDLVLIHEDKENIQDEQEDSAMENLTKAQYEGRLYAQKIKEWLGHTKKQPLQIIDDTTKQQRDIQYRDIVILLRSMTDAPTIVEELKKANIPVYAELKSGYFAAIEIQIMINLLKIIDNPYQDIPFVSVLRSPIVGLTEDQLAQIRLEKRYDSFYEAAVSFSKRTGTTNELVKQFLTDLAHFRKQAREDSLSNLIWSLYQQTGYYDFVGGIPGGRQRQANLRALYDRARSYEETTFRGLFRFLRFIERMETKNKDLGEARALSEQEDVVRIMTIHQSKGLEFPVVILGNINKQFNFKDLREKYITNKEYGFATKFIDPVKRISYSTLYYMALREEEKRHMLSEEMRVLYVALTRAKEKLLIGGYVPDLDKELSSWQQSEQYSTLSLPIGRRKNATTYLDWIGHALVRHKQQHLLREGASLSSEIPEIIALDSSKWNIDFISEQDVETISELETISETELKHTLQNWEKIKQVETGFKEEVVARLQYSYPYEQASKSSAKQSVTEIKRRYEQVDEYSSQQFTQRFAALSKERPAFLTETKALSPAEIGTAMHSVMQHIPLTKRWTVEEIHPLLDRFVAEEKITKEEQQHIDVEAIAQFFQSDLATYMIEKEVKREVPFSYTLDAEEVYKNWMKESEEKVFIQGVIDCLIFTEKGVLLLDYKTDAIDEEEITEEVIEELKDRYRIQMTLYKQAIEDMIQVKVIQSYLYFFAKNIFITMDEPF